MREKLSFQEFNSFQGIATKTTPEKTKLNYLRSAINCDLFESYGAVFKPPGTRRVLSDILRESGSAVPINWVGFYKSADLDGQLLRHVLIAGGTNLYRVENDGTTTQLTGGSNPVGSRTSGLIHASQNVEDFLVIQNQNPDLVGQGDIPVKYDGNDIHRWGILAPGSTETVEESFADSSIFSTTGIDSIANESTTTRDGASTKITTGTALQAGDLELTSGVSSSPNLLITDRQSVFIYIPRGQLKNFSKTAATPAVQVFVGNDLSSDYYQFDFPIGALLEGWNELFLNYSNRITNEASGNTDDPNVSITGTPSAPFTQVRFRVNSVDASTQIENVVWDRWVTFDAGALTATENAASGTTFTSGKQYKYKVTYVSKYGHESNAGPESVEIALSEAKDQIDLTSIPVSPDSQIIARNLYRTVGGGEIFLFLDRINNNDDTTFSDTTGDLSLGQTSPPLAGDVSDDNSPPPQAGILKLWKRTVFVAGLPDRPEVVVYSEDDEPESFPTLNEVALDEKITAIYETYSGLVIETEKGKWQVTGDNPDFQFDKVINNIGCVGRRAAGETRIEGWAVDREGMRLFNLNNPTKISEVIRDKFDNDFNKVNLELLQTAHSKARNAILMLVANASGEYKGNSFIYQYALDQIDSGWWWELQLPTSINPLHFQEIEDANGDFRLYFGGDDGMLYELFAAGEKNWTLADGSTEAIVTEFQSKYVRLGSQGERGEDFEGRALPRLMEVHYKGDTPAIWDVTLDMAHGSTQDSATATREFYFNFNENESRLTIPIQAVQPCDYARFKLRNEEKNVAGGITNIRLYFRTQPGQYPLETGSMRTGNN